MATKKKVSIPTGGHTPVTNLSKEAAEATSPTATASRPPSEGKDPQTPKPRKDGAEDVKGLKLKLTESASMESFQARTKLKAPTAKLPDIGEASFGPPPARAESVIGVDDRIRITNTDVYPWRVHASLQITARDGSQWIGTGWFIGPHTLITAGHVVYIKNSGVPGRDGWARSIDVMPGRNTTTLPYGKVTSKNFRSVTGWTNSGDENFDYGAIIIPNELGNTTGWFGFGVYSDADLKASVGNISGYPGDKPAGTQWYDARKIANVNARKVYYEIDTFGGQSGSAVYRIIDGQRYGIAIHAYGGSSNSGTRIVTPVFDNMVAWKA
jgi:V8-like Glu-specific endopeptidase